MTALSIIAQKAVFTVHVDDSISAVKQILSNNRISCVPVIDSNGSCFGVITENDLMHFFSDQRNGAVEKAWEICTHAVQAVAPDMPLTEVIHKMVEEQYHHLVVMEQGVVRGIISSLDLVRHLRDQLNKA